jgi:hypothetical protein
MADKKEIQKLNRSIPMIVKGSFVRDSDDFHAGLEKAKADFTRKAADSGFGGLMPDSTKVPLMYVDPMFDPILLMFPKENVKELNRRLRHYYTYHPILRNVIDLHSSAPDTLVFCNPGVKEIKDFKGGERVLCADGQFHPVLWQQKHPFNGEMFTIKPYYYPEIKFTYNHPIQVYNIKTQKTTWVLTHTLTKDDYLVVPKLKAYQTLPVLDLADYIKLHSTITVQHSEHSQTGKHHTDIRVYKAGTKVYKDNIARCYTVLDDTIMVRKSHQSYSRKLPITEDFCELLGWYVAEGCSTPVCCTFSLNKNEAVPKQRILDLLKTVFNITGKVRTLPHSVQVYFCSKLHGQLLAEVGGKLAENKQIPEWLLYAPTGHIKAFLRGYFSGDGCFKAKDNTFTFVTVSKQLAYQIVLLMNKIGIPLSISKRVKPYYVLPEYIGRALKSQVRLQIFGESLPVRKKKEYGFYKEDQNNFYIKIRDIKSENYVGDVYDIKTDKKNFCVPCVVHNSEFSLSDFELRCEDKEIEKYYNELKDKLNLLQLMVNMNRDYWLLGESFEYGNWDETNLEWSGFNQYPPENIDVHKTYMGSGAVYFLKADEELKKVLNSAKDVDRAVASLIPAEFKDSVKQNKPFQLANERLIHFARRPSGYSLRGESIVKSVLKDLLYEDKLRLLQYTVVDRLMTPIKLWKIGSAEKGWIPAPKHFKAFQQQLIQACNDPDFQLITHPFVNVEFLTGVGKAQPLDADLLTKTGFKKMGSVGINDKILGPDGHEHKVLAIYPQGKRDVYQVKFNDGTSTECTEDHLWEVNTTQRRWRKQPGLVLPLKVIKEKPSKWFIPVTKPVAGLKLSKDAIHPYVLGVLLGDGCLTQVDTLRFAANEEFIVNKVKMLVPATVEVRQYASARPCEYNIVKRHGMGVGYHNTKVDLTVKLDKLGLIGTNSGTKFIPDIYKYASIEDRLNLLQGLMDTDGYITQFTSHCVYTTKSTTLASDVKYLIQSLGGIAKLKPILKKYKGEKRLYYAVTCVLPIGVTPVSLPRKVARYTRCKYFPVRKIVSVSLVGQKPCQCIKLDSLEGLYLTNDCIVTHNTEDLIKHFEFVHKRIMMGLFANDSMVRGEASPYASQAVSMRVVMHRYLTNRTLLEKLVKEKIFLPVAVAHGFVKRTTAELSHKVRTSGPKFHLPQFFYNQRLNLMNNTAEQEMLLRLRDKGEIPMELIADVFGWDLESIKTAFQHEQSTELDPNWRNSLKEAIKDPKVRNQVLDGQKVTELTLPETPAPTAAHPGRPAKPEEEKYAAVPAIIPPGPGAAAPRSKQIEKGGIPAPVGETPKAAPVIPETPGINVGELPPGTEIK